MKALINFMNGSLGRAARVVLGLALVYVGLIALHGGTTGVIIAVVGLLPIAMGVWGRCLIEFLAPQARHA